MSLYCVSQYSRYDFRHGRILLQCLRGTAQVQGIAAGREHSLKRCNFVDRRSGSAGVCRSFVFRKRIAHLPRKILVCIEHPLEILLRDEENLIGNAELARDKLHRVERLDVIWVSDADFEGAIHECKRHETVVPGRCQWNIAQYFFRHRRITEDARRQPVLLPCSKKRILECNAVLAKRISERLLLREVGLDACTTSRRKKPFIDK